MGGRGRHGRLMGVDEGRIFSGCLESHFHARNHLCNFTPLDILILFFIVLSIDCINVFVYLEGSLVINNISFLYGLA